VVAETGSQIAMDAVLVIRVTGEDIPAGAGRIRPAAQVREGGVIARIRLSDRKCAVEGGIGYVLDPELEPILTCERRSQFQRDDFAGPVDTRDIRPVLVCRRREGPSSVLCSGSARA
jgi:hypothetical protein